ncbi:MAG: hypothetical protein MPJ50_18105 [Pirellulales bacterium]|nr:hypothetical protein [Pirellulales bacterium]
MEWLKGMVLVAITACVTAWLTVESYSPGRKGEEPRPTPSPAAEEFLVFARESSPSPDSYKKVFVRLKSATDQPIPVATNLRALHRLGDALEWGWASEVGRLIYTGDVILAPHGTRAELLEEETFHSKIRFRDALGATRVGFLISDSFNPRFVKLDG